MMQAADPHAWGNVDVLLTESTYAERDHPDREKTEKEFLDAIQGAVSRGGRVLIPVFAVGRAQEVLLMLERRQWSVPVYLDGMARKVTSAIVDGQSPYATSKNALRSALRDAKPIGSRSERESIADLSGIFVTTSGMLQGGPAMYYLEQLWNDSRSAVLLTGFQVKGTPGWFLDNQRTIRLNGETVEVKCEIHRFDFSAHLSRQGIMETIRATKPKVVVFMHGDPEATKSLAAWAAKEVGATAYAPMVGDQIDLTDGSVSQLHVYTADDGYRFPDEHQHPHRFAYDDVSHDE